MRKRKRIRSHIAVEGEKVNCDEDFGELSADMMIGKILLNSTISTEGTLFKICNRISQDQD